MNKEKYKSVVVDKKTYEYIKQLSEGDDRSISATVRRYFMGGLDSEAYEANLDSELIKGGTRRLKRLKEDLQWFKKNADVGLKKYYIIDSHERMALDLLIDMLEDICN